MKGGVGEALSIIGDWSSKGVKKYADTLCDNTSKDLLSDTRVEIIRSGRVKIPQTSMLYPDHLYIEPRLNDAID